MSFDHRGDIASRIAELRAAAIETYPGDACARYLALQAEFDATAQAIRRALLGTPLAWTDEEQRDARRLHRGCDDLAALGYRVAAAAEASSDPRGRTVAAAALFYMGETVKWDIASAPDAPHDLGRTHALLRRAMRAGTHRIPLEWRVDGHRFECNLETLYFRVLLLARFASGALNIRQIEILDAWMWLWMPVLEGVSEAPAGSALRADLDSSGGLVRGPRKGPGPSLYLRQAQIEHAFDAVVAEFHAGRMVPAEGFASEFRIEEHVAVLELVARNLGDSKRESASRAPRRAGDREVEIQLGLTEILARALAPAAPTAGALTFSLIDRLREPGARRTRPGEATVDIYGIDDVRKAFLEDESDTGLGLEGALSVCGDITAGDLVAVKTGANEPLCLGKVVRRAPARSRGRVVLAIRRIGVVQHVVKVACDRAGRENQEQVLFVPGPESSGCLDAWLVPERVFAERAPFKAIVSGVQYTFRLNRVRDRGHGWVLAGFEIAGAVAAREPKAA